MRNNTEFYPKNYKAFTVRECHDLYYNKLHEDLTTGNLKQKLAATSFLLDIDFDEFVQIEGHQEKEKLLHKKLRFALLKFHPDKNKTET